MINMNDRRQLEEIAELYRQAFAEMDEKRGAPEIYVSFYPYVGLNHTIRVRDGLVFIRITELCREMPMQGHRALAIILVSKLLGKRVPPSAREVYLGYAKSTEIRLKAVERKRARGRKIINGAAGTYYDLNEIFDDLNTKYFSGNLPKPTLTWSANRTYRMLGHHDATHETVVISRSLDAQDTPRYVIEYIMFHEMLHILHPTIHQNGRRYNHTPAFRRDERRFPQYVEAEKWIELNSRKLKRRATRR